MIANVISVVRTIGKAVVPVIQYIWNLIETQWEVRDANWED